MNVIKGLQLTGLSDFGLMSCCVTRRDMEQDFRDKLTALRSQSEQESEALLQQVERERNALQEELELIRAQETELQEELCSTTQVSPHHLHCDYTI